MLPHVNILDGEGVAIARGADFDISPSAQAPPRDEDASRASSDYGSEATP